MLKAIIVIWPSNDKGATAIEYALIASLIAVALVGVLSALGINSPTSSTRSAAQLK